MLGDVDQLSKYCLFSAEILALCDSFCLVNREFYFDRSPRIFENILGLYRKGELHLTESVCPKDFVGELEYWGLSALYLEPCCAYTLQRASWLLPVVDHGVDKDEQVSVTRVVSGVILYSMQTKLPKHTISCEAGVAWLIGSPNFRLF